MWLSEVESVVSELAPGGKDAAMYLWDRSNRQGTDGKFRDAVILH